jgi:hydrogenase maturation factor HypF (carbamoyltransferase family)
METFLYNCHFCGIEYQPKRRHIQKFCCNSCRSKAYIQKHKLNSDTKLENKDEIKNPVKIEKISVAGVGNAFLGTLAVNVASNLFTSEGNKPATKNDIKNLSSILKNRYHQIKNIPVRNDGAVAFYDFETQNYVYLKTQTK